MNNGQIKIIKYEEVFADQTVRMWRDSKEQAINQNERHHIHSHKYYLSHILPDHYDIDLALLDNQVIGMIAYNEVEISQLYIHVDYQGIGIGKQLLNRAKNYSNGKLQLYTFDKNEYAKTFYEKNGFKKVGIQLENEENLTAIQYEWRK
ncbi:GNAT family N-acetyltransferase [Mammaliicoccus stepanovicii]|uniref:Putative regulatory protein PaiA n=1 Tax=Mammaliicoccus stepanovicii TaxID=643214 RepID=A0A239YK88_9STAP|nr:GNAT family N-acetyltransferase [Mammaliicoccus stepanovicii]PNZ76871.1 GNAT family N-acetyltransferase [Mammaliicoccus stepanovicii]GGI41075.1 hypothetical protein GCM10010896_11550 [Mammaliicoccus stepanovicii]SNV59529.1 putative regulatory protein PaiA [Mammaliicoccus stepanovicii]